MTAVDETKSVVEASRAHANPAITVDQRAKIAHFQEQNKFVAPNNERLDFGLKERINER